MTPSRLYRLAGLACALLLVINAARRGGLLPDGAFLNAIAPLGALTGLLALTGVYLWQRVPSGVFGLVGFALNFAGLAGAFAIEYTLHFVFRYLPKDQVTTLVDGGTGAAFRVTAIVLISGVLVFGYASWRARRYPVGAVALYVVGMVPGALRTVVPEPVYLGGLVVAAAGVAWLSLALLAPAREDVLTGGS
ncbi:MAG: hypothetical protein AUI10_01190 [Actinobacteria bacterium 13_2_20CM_2_72_6]|nr:MAG: hypothetical protein AUI10_01190 [Actinobacteria bacterium 13_2_20CM_2_72_6]